jgi:hypothetical protein
MEWHEIWNKVVAVSMLLMGSLMKFLLIGVIASFFKATSDLQYNYRTTLHRNIAVIVSVTHDLPVLGSNLHVKCLNPLMYNNNSNSILENFFTERLISLCTLPVVHPGEVMLTLWARGLERYRIAFLTGSG